MKQTTKAWIALIYICIVWGTTYYVIRVGAQQWPPFLFASMRQLIAGAIIIGAAVATKGWPRLTPREWGFNLLIGFLMIAVGNGIVTWAEKEVPSGVAALVCALMPVCAVLINLVISKRERITPTIAAGLALGVGGVALIVREDLAAMSDPKYLARVVAIFFGTAGWALGSVIGKKQAKPQNPTFNAGVQLFAGGVFLALGSLLFDRYEGFVAFQPDALWSMAYLIVFGSILAYTAYMFCLRVLPVGIVTSYAYINPLVAVLLAWHMNDGEITLWTLLSFVAITVGVALVNFGYQRLKAKLANQDEGPSDR